MKKDVFVLIARLIVGGIFIGAGLMKAVDMGMTVGYFSQMGLPAAIAYIVSYAEILGGVAVVLGLWTELASAGLLIIMAGATYYGYKMAPAMNMPVFQAIMPTLSIFAALLMLVVSGAGRIAVQRRQTVA